MGNENTIQTVSDRVDNSESLPILNVRLGDMYSFNFGVISKNKQGRVIIIPEIPDTPEARVRIENYSKVLCLATAIDKSEYPVHAESYGMDTSYIIPIWNVYGCIWFDDESGLCGVHNNDALVTLLTLDSIYYGNVYDNNVVFTEMVSRIDLIDLFADIVNKFNSTRYSNE